MIDQDGLLTIKEQCQLLGLSRSGYYYAPTDETELREPLKTSQISKINDIIINRGFKYG